MHSNMAKMFINNITKKHFDFNMRIEALNVRRGCIKTSKGPWLVRRATKDGTMVTSFRFPTEGQRQQNKARERLRRAITSKIFEGLRAHGNYQLSENGDGRNDLLKALCEEAGWHVEDDGTIFRKFSCCTSNAATKCCNQISSSSHTNSSHVSVDSHLEEEEFCSSDAATKVFPQKISLSQKYNEEREISLTLSL